MNGDASSKWVVYDGAFDVGLCSGFYLVEAHVKVDGVATNISLLSNVSKLYIRDANIGIAFQNL